MRMWLAMLAIAVVLTGCGILFALQDLGTANEYASIASFFLALLTASGSVLSLTRAKAENQNRKSREESPAGTRDAPVYIATGNENVVQGNHNHVKYTKTVDLRRGRKDRRRG